MTGLFDKFSKILQINRSFRRKDFNKANYIAENVSENILERLHEIKNLPKNPLILGGRNFYLNGFETEKNITITDISEIALMRKMHLLHDQMDKTKLIVTEDEWMPFRKNNFDAAISCLNSHWIENLKDYGLQVRSILQKDSPFLGAMIGGNSLFELKQSLEKAESINSTTSFRARFSPTIRAEDVGRFLTESRFKSITVDSEAITVHYPNIESILTDLRAYASYIYHYLLHGLDMTLTVMDSAIQIVDENKNFKVEELSAFFKETAALSNSCSPVVAVFGSQSSGKSTLLNYLFDTKFDVMSGDKRSQTTHGIWLAVEPFENIIILDVEGTDGRERGEDRDFERKAALFSLAIADVLIINIWENSIGLYNASNINLLKTVLDVYFEIYSSICSTKTTILFVVRDYVGVTSMEALETILLEEVQKIWDAIEKPISVKANSFEDVFSLKFAFLPHKIFKAADFLCAVDKLREQFFSKNEENSIFDRTSNKRTLLQDFPEYSSSIWDVIISSKSLDLPTQQELLAQHRCEEAISDISKVLSDKFLELNLLIDNDELENAVEKLKLVVGTANDEYFERLHRYSINVVQAKCEVLQRRIKELIEPLFQNYCNKIEKKSLKIFEFELKSSNEKFSENALHESIQRAVVFYRTSIQGFINISGGINFESKIRAFEAELEQISLRKLEDFFSKTSRNICKNFKTSTRSIFADCFQDCSKDFWNKVEQQYMEKIADSLSEFDFACESFSKSDLLSSARDCLENELISIYRESLLSESSKSIMGLRFAKVLDKNFRFDSSGRPRHWESLIMIDEAYDKAISKIEALIEIVSTYLPSEKFISVFPNFEKEMHILSVDSKYELKELVRKDAEVMFLDAKRALVSGTGPIPIWVIILLVVLGWNEFVAIVSSPIYLLLTLIIISSLFIAHHLHLSGPLMNFVYSLMNYLNATVNSVNDVNVKAKDE